MRPDAAAMMMLDMIKPKATLPLVFLKTYPAIKPPNNRQQEEDESQPDHVKDKNLRWTHRLDHKGDARSPACLDWVDGAVRGR